MGEVFIVVILLGTAPNMASPGWQPLGASQTAVTRTSRTFTTAT